ncbi:hypothetical protein pb186bvf_015296 [Paramecium bursaria]
MKKIEKLKVYNHQTDEYEFSEDFYPDQQQFCLSINSQSDSEIDVSQSSKINNANSFTLDYSLKGQNHKFIRKNQKEIQKHRQLSNYYSIKTEQDDNNQTLENRNQDYIFKQSQISQIEKYNKKIGKLNIKLDQQHKINIQLRKKCQQLSLLNISLNKDLEKLRQDDIVYQEKASKYFNKQFNKQLFKDINLMISQKNQDYEALIKQEQNLQQQYDELLNFTNSINNESQIYFQSPLYPQFFKQISDYLSQSRQEIENYRQFLQSLTYDCESLFQLQLNSITFQEIKQLHQNQMDNLHQSHKLQLINLKAQYDLNEKELSEQQASLKILQQKLLSNESKIKKMQIQIDEYEENIQKGHNNQNDQVYIQNLKDKINKYEVEIQRLELEKQNNYVIEINKANKMQLEINQLKNEISEKQKDCEELNVLLNQSNIIIEEKKKQLQNSQKTIQDLNNQLFEIQLNQKLLEEQMKQKIEHSQKIEQENQNNILFFFNKEQEYKNKIDQLQNENDSMFIELKQKETTVILLQNLNEQLQSKYQNKENDLALIIQSINDYKIQQTQVEEIQVKENSILKMNINFIISKLQPNQKVDQVIPLIKKLSEHIAVSELVFDLNLDPIYQEYLDPFDEEDIMIQQDTCKVLDIQYNEQLLMEIIQHNHPPNFEQLFIIKEKVQKIVVQRSINPNETSSYFNGYFIRNMKSKKKLYFVREEKINDHDSIEQLKSQLGHRHLLLNIISAFNKQLEENNLAYPNLQLPPTMYIKILGMYLIQNLGQRKYFYCEGLIQDYENNDQTYINYISALKYFSYYYSNGVYMITDIHIYGNYIYDTIISSKYGILSSYDQGQNEIIEQREALNPSVFDYEEYKMMMDQIQAKETNT